ncbi:uncharacterized protein LOC133815378 [Humulus lupulus]|uniref:uncharacterized protein LOC133815378 n=1 Tax=Humulus lupulus TaxID=3486 RepID=UPI002B4049FF|nr:uncharacterized protein LOC133815378 [Humulus lupulus]
MVHFVCIVICLNQIAEDNLVVIHLLVKDSEISKMEKQNFILMLEVHLVFTIKLGKWLAFRGDDESEDSSNRGNFLEVLKFLADHNEDIKAVTLTNAPENLKLTSPDIEKDIVRAATFETLDIIIKEIGDALFSILVDESRDISTKEQMVVVLRYVDKDGRVIERFGGIEHVANTTAVPLKGAIDKLFSRYGLSISKLRGQGYDGASNMQGEFSGLKTLILNENASAFYVHCFAHQPQLALVAVRKKHILVAYLFSVVTMVINVVGCSSKRCDILREKQDVIISEALMCGEISSGRRLNQETNLKCPGDTRWGSHYSTLRKDQDIANAMKLVEICKKRLQAMRDNEWDSFLNQVSTFCAKYNVDVPDMDDTFVAQGRSQRKTQEMTNLHHYRVEFFFVVIDIQLQELNERFNELLTKKKLARFAEYYLKKISTFELMILDDQLETYIIDVRSTENYGDKKKQETTSQPNDNHVSIAKASSRNTHPNHKAIVVASTSAAVQTTTQELSSECQHLISLLSQQLQQGATRTEYPQHQTPVASNFSGNNSSISTKSWIVDSGPTHHICHDTTCFANIY